MRHAFLFVSEEMVKIGVYWWKLSQN